MSLKPSTNQVPEYYQPYVQRLPDDHLIGLLEKLGQELVAKLKLISEEQSRYRYADDKWMVKELLGHINDAERIYTYRALCISRGEQISLPGFDENSYVKMAHADERPWLSLISEFEGIRKSTIDLYRSLNTDQMNRQGTANDLAFSPEIIGFITVGHQYHHQQILKDRYQLPK